MTVEETFRKRLKETIVTQLIRQEYWCGGQLGAEVNVLFARVEDSRWIRFFFDAGVFFWREVVAPVAPEAQGDYCWHLLPAELPGLVLGSAVDEIEFSGNEGAMPRSLTIRFKNCSGFTLENNVHDQQLLVSPYRTA